MRKAVLKMTPSRSRSWISQTTAAFILLGSHHSSLLQCLLWHNSRINPAVVFPLPSSGHLKSTSPQPRGITETHSMPFDKCLQPLKWLCTSKRASQVAQMVKNLPAMQETPVWSLGQEDPLEKDMAIHPVFLPGEPHRHRSLMGYSPWCHKELDVIEQLNNNSIYIQKEMLSDLYRLALCTWR